jgi:hypothetical protein
MANIATVQGQLSFDDFVFPRTPTVSSRADEYDLIFTAFGQPAQISLMSTNQLQYDPYIEIIDARTNAVIAFDNNDGDGNNSLISGFVPLGGVPYKIRVTSFNPINITQEHLYTLQVNTGMGDVALMPRLSSFSNPQTGQVVNLQGVLNEADYTFDVAWPSLADEYQLSVTAFNQPIQVSLVTSAFNPVLQIIDARTGQVKDQDDNLISGFLPQAGVDYRIRVTSFNQLTLPSAMPLSYSLQVSTAVGTATVTPRTVGGGGGGGGDLLGQLNTPFTRFQNTSVPGTYLFAGPIETANIRRNFPGFKEEGIAFQVGIQANDSLLKFTRFQNTSVPGTYLFAGPEEAANIRQNYPNFKEEGLAFYALDSSLNLGTQMYRFQNLNVPGTYLFVGAQERDNILASFPNFRLEGEAFEVVG